MKIKLEEVKKLIDEKYSIADLAKHFNASSSQIRYFLKKNKLRTDGYKKEFSWEKDKILNAIIGANSKSDILRNMGLSTKSGNFQTLDRYCFLYSIEVPLFVRGANDSNTRFKQKVTNEELFCENSKHASTTIKNRVIKDKLIEYKCEKCDNNGEWMGEKISLQLDHNNGKNSDNRLENLRFLCPNCHSQTTTWGSKRLKKKTLCECGGEKSKSSDVCLKCFKNGKGNNKIKFEVEKDVLEKLINEKSYREIGRMFGVIDNTIKKRALKLGIKLQVRNRRKNK